MSYNIKQIGSSIKVVNYGNACLLATTNNDNYIVLTPDDVKELLNFLIENGWKFWAESPPPK